MSRLSIFICVIVCMILFSVSNAIQFSLREHKEECISKAVTKNEFISGEFTLKPEGSVVDYKVFDPIGHSLIKRDEVPDGRFAYTTSHSGEYRICFNNKKSRTPLMVNIDLKTGIEAKPTGAAKKKSLRPMEVQVKHLEEIVGGIVKDESWMNERQDRMREVNESTSSMIFWFNICIVVVAIGSYLFQDWYLKNFFRRKKLVRD